MRFRRHPRKTGFSALPQVFGSKLGSVASLIVIRPFFQIDYRWLKHKIRNFLFEIKQFLVSDRPEEIIDRNQKYYNVNHFHLF